MAISKVIFNGQVLMDVTDKTVDSNNLLSGETALKNDGTSVVGTLEVIPDNKVIEKDINFIDYDGTILYSYTIDEFDELSEMPPNPTHQGLIAQGWNWTKETIDNVIDGFDLRHSYTSENEKLPIWVGQSYITASGDTEIDIFLTNSTLSFDFRVYADDATINWGDGTFEDISNMPQGEFDPVEIPWHTYSQPGKYTISIHNNSGTFYFEDSESFSGGGAGGPMSPHNYSGDYYTTTINNYTYSNTITAIRIGNGFSFNRYEFIGCFDLKYITIPISVGSVYPYDEGVIYDGTFQGCFSLKSVTFPKNSFQKCREQVFVNCLSLETVSFPESIIRIGMTNFFNNCYSLKSVTLFLISHLYTEYANASSMFENCYNLKTPNTFFTVYEGQFQDCKSLTTVFLYDVEDGIPIYTFTNSNLYEITINDTSQIGQSAFERCQLLTTVTFNNPNVSFHTFDTKAFTTCSKLKNITLPNTTTTIGNQAFSYCSNLTNCSIPNTVTTIGSYAFDSSGLTSFNIPTGLTTLNAGVLRFTNLTSLTIPSNITSIGASALYIAANSVEFHFESTTPPTLANKNAFNTSTTTIYVPYSADHSVLNAYKTASNWSALASIIQEETP